MLSWEPSSAYLLTRHIQAPVGLDEKKFKVMYIAGHLQHLSRCTKKTTLRLSSPHLLRHPNDFDCGLYRDTPLKDLTGWPECISKQAIEPEDSPLRYVMMVAYNLADSLATDIPEGFGIGQKTITLSSSKMMRAITFVASLK